MAKQNSILNIEMEPIIQSTPVSSMPLRRKSILIQKESPNVLLYNDDEAERLAVRNVNKSGLASVTSVTNGRRRSLGLAFLENMPEPKIAEHMSQCIKLSAENKINVKNAFSLEIIDFMTYMARKRDSNMSNLQIASTSLDASTKIYGFRVDGVHTDILKIIGALDKHSRNDETDKIDNNMNENDQNQIMKTKKKLKRKNKQKVLSTEEALNGNIEIGLYPPIMKADQRDLQTTDLLYLASLPVHANNLTEPFYLRVYNDVILDFIDKEVNHANNPAKFVTLVIQDFVDLNICTSLSNFDFLTWSLEEEAEEMQSQENVQSEENRFEFDPDESISFTDEVHLAPMTCVDVDEQENVNFCIKEGNHHADNIYLRDAIMQPIIKSLNVSEYSFIHKNLRMCWAGPSYWKIKIFNKPLSNTNVIEKCQQTAVKKKKEIKLLYNKEIKLKTNEKFGKGQQLKLQMKTARNEWLEKKITLPKDTHYKPMELFNMYYYPLITLYLEDKGGLNCSQKANDNNDFNCNDDSGMSNYCPADDAEDNHLESEELELCNKLEGAETQMPLIGDNLISAPKLANKIHIQYSQLAKKVDMRQLKKSLWKCLISSTSQEKTTLQEMVQQETEDKMKNSKHFSEVYKTLPTLLSKTNMESLSFPISFVSLLHLANERSLKITPLMDMSDLIIEAE